MRQNRRLPCPFRWSLVNAGGRLQSANPHCLQPNRRLPFARGIPLRPTDRRPASSRYRIRLGEWRQPLRSCKIIEYAEAKQIVDALVAEISKAGGAGVIAVVDPAGELIAFARMDGAPPSSIRIAANKAYSAARERKTTEEIGKKARHPEKGFEMAWFGDDRFVGWGGGVRYGAVVKWSGRLR